MENLNEYCKDCSEKLSEDEKMDFNGYCESCYEERFGRRYRYRKLNFTATFLKFIAVSIGLIGTFMGVFNLQISSNGFGIIIIVLSIIGAVFINGFSVIIQLLEDIYREIRGE